MSTDAAEFTFNALPDDRVQCTARHDGHVVTAEAQTAPDAKAACVRILGQLADA